jgi:hypothetical protein
VEEFRPDGVVEVAASWVVHSITSCKLLIILKLAWSKRTGTIVDFLHSSELYLCHY